jgi:hypothetical protein
MAAKQVHRLTRGKDGLVRRIEIPDDLLLGRTDQVLASRLFGLQTTLDLRTQKLVKEYQSLLGLARPTTRQRHRIEVLEEQLELRIPVPEEGPAERRAMEFLRKILESRFEGTERKARNELLASARVLLEEVSQGASK